MEYPVILEKGETSWGAYAPDLPGCVAVAEDAEEVKTLMRETIRMHLADLKERGLPIPEPSKVLMVASG